MTDLRVPKLEQERKITIIVNGLGEEVPESFTITDLITYFSEEDVHLIVELNGRFIYAENYNREGIKPGDRLEFIHPNIGG